jgi:NADH:ubiquinone oxidoreductase subunit 6 (subunit J)
MGGVLIFVALVLAAMQDLKIVNIYGSVENKWYFYGIIGVILLVGIVMAVWGLAKKEAPKQSNPQ